MKRKGNKKIVCVLATILVIAVGMGIYMYTGYMDKNPTTREVVDEHTISKYADDMKFSGEPLDYKARYGFCEGMFEGELKNTFVTSKEELQSYLSQYGTVYVGGEEDAIYEDVEQHKAEEFFDEEFFQEHTLAIEVHDGGSTNDHYCLDSVTLTGNMANININYTKYQYGGPLAPHLVFNFYILGKEITGTKFNFKTEYVNNTEDADSSFKPIIYLYPQKEQKVDVILGRKENVICSYPKYEDGWHVLASPDGTLEDLENGKQLYSLYYENKNAVDFSIVSDGFVVKGEEVATFLEEKLALLGLNYKEAEEFIIYWLPKLEQNNYNYIRFATMDEIEENMPLFVSGNPDTVIRVLMEYKPLSEPIEVTEQKLITPKREGFTVVEWGGTRIK